MLYTCVAFKIKQTQMEKTFVKVVGKYRAGCAKKTVGDKDICLSLEL